jgi:tetratricopeptide (TPR) repeat protein
MDRMMAQKKSIDQVIMLLEAGDFLEAQAILGRILTEDLSNPHVGDGLKITAFWLSRLEEREKAGEIEQADFLYSQWFRFFSFVERQENFSFEMGFLAVKKWVFQRVLTLYEEQKHQFRENDSSYYLRTGRCCKFLGRFDQALKLIEEALRHDRNSAEIMAEFGDCYGLLNEVDYSKVLFREAFYLDPQRVNLDLIESGYMKRLIDRVRIDKKKEEEIKEWIPVYAVIYQVFDVKREMKELEAGRLRQSIYGLRSELKSPDKEWRIIPRLLYRYFLLVDYFLSSGTERSKIDDIMKRIELLDPEIFKLYIS